MNRRRFIKTGLLFVPTVFSAGLHGSVRLASLEPEVNNWMGRVVTNAGSYTSRSIVANDTWMKMVRSAGVRSLVRRANTYTGLNLLACATPLINTFGSSVETTDGLTDANYTEATGIAGAGGGFLGTGYIPSTMTPSDNDAHIAVYNRTNAHDDKVALGSLDNGSSSVDWLIVGYVDTNSYGAIHNGATPATLSDGSNPTGWYQANRLGAADLQLYKNGASVASTATSAGTRPTTSIIVHAYNNITLGAQLKTSKVLAGYSLGAGMTAAQSLAYFAAWDRLQRILGRNV